MKSKKSVEQITQRLNPGEDLRRSIERLIRTHDIAAGCIASIVGSVEKLTLRMADGRTTKVWNKQFELVSGMGTVSKNGCHIHISAADKNGVVKGGHLKEGCIINTTAEVVLLRFSDTQFKRMPDKRTGYD